MRTVKVIQIRFLPLKWPMRLLAILLLVASTLQGCREAGDSNKPLAKILSQLDPACAEADRSQAIEDLRHFGTNAFPFLIAEMNSFKWQAPEEKNKEVLLRTRRLRAAFEVFGTNLVPLTSDFIANLDTNRNFVSALDGLAAMREVGAEHLIAAMTNRQAPVRLNAVAAIMEVGTNSNIAKLASPNLIVLLNDQSVFTRYLAVETLGMYCLDPDTCVPILLKLAIDDPDLVVRSQAIKAVGRIQVRFGPMSVKTKLVLEKISKQDESQVVRWCAERVLAGKDP